MSGFAAFTRAFPPAEPTAASSGDATSAPARAQDAAAPADLVQFWREVGHGAFGDGILWFPPPADLARCYRDWLSGLPDALPFARTSFGLLYVWLDGMVNLIDVQAGDVFDVLPSFTQFVDDYLPGPEAREDDLRTELHQAALREFGPLGEEEMFTFVPALVLGGAPDVDHVEKVRMAQQVAMLAALHLE